MVLTEHYCGVYALVAHSHFTGGGKVTKILPVAVVLVLRR